MVKVRLSEIGISNLIKRNYRMYGIRGLLNLFGLYVGLKLRPSYCFYEPVVLQVEVSSKCNLRCSMCRRSFENIKGINMSFEDFTSTLKKFKYLNKIKFVGLGESFINPDFIKMVEYACKKGLVVEIVTNGTMLTRERLEKLRKLGVHNIEVSIEAFEKKAYEKIRRGARFEDVINNVKRTIDLGFDVRINTISVLGKTHIKKYLDIKSAKIIKTNLGGKDVILKNPEIKLFIKNKSKTHTIRLQPAEISIGCPNPVFMNKKDAVVYGFCTAPWEEPYVNSEGYMTACSWKPLTKDWNYGSIFEKNFSELWNNKKMRMLRINIKRKKMDSLCLGCFKYR